MKTDIAKYHKIHLIFALVYFYQSWHWIDSGCAWLAQDGSTLNATHCTFTSNNAENYGGAILALVGHCIQRVLVLENRIHFDLWHSFVLKVPGIVAISLMDPHHTASQFWHLVCNRLNMYIIGFERPAPMMWWCDCGSSPCRRLLWNADVVPTHGCVHKSLVPMRREKGHDTAYKMAMTLEKQNEDHGVRVSNWLLLSCGVNLSYQIFGWRACCSRTAAWVRDDIFRSQRTNFHFERPVYLSFQYWGCGMIFEICTLFAPQEGSNVRTMFGAIVFFPHSLHGVQSLGE